MILTPLQKAQIFKQNPNAGMFLLLQKFEQEYKQQIAELTAEFASKLETLSNQALETFAAVKQMQKGEKGDTVTGPQGDVGLVGPKGESIVGPKGDRGEPGKTIVGPRGERGEVGPVGPVGLPGQDGSPDTPEQVLAKLEKVKIPIDVIENLRQVLNTLAHNINELKSRKLQGAGGGGGGGMGNIQTDNFTGDNATTAFTLTYNVASSGHAILVMLNGQVQEITTHFTISGKTLTFTTAPWGQAAIHVWYIRK